MIVSKGELKYIFPIIILVVTCCMEMFNTSYQIVSPQKCSLGFPTNACTSNKRWLK